MRIPVWVTLAVAALVIGFGGYRLFLGLRKDRDLDTPKRGLYGMSKRTHLIIGTFYLLLGAGLVATSFGWNPFGSAIGPDTEEPKQGEEPSKPGSVPIDQLPEKKK